MIGGNPHSLTIPRKTAFDAVIQADHAAGVSRAEMARKYDMTHEGLDGHLRRLGLHEARAIEQAPPAMEPIAVVPEREAKRAFPSDEDLLADRAAGMTHAVIARKYGCSLTTLGAALKRLGVAQGRWPGGRYVPPPELARPKGPPKPRKTKDTVADAPVAAHSTPALPEPRSADEADIDFLILAARICAGSKCSPATAIGIVTAWRAMR